MNQKNLFTPSALAIAVAILSSNAYAAGFQLNEASSSGLGRAFSGDGAIIDNASAGSRNPATLTMFDRPALSVGAVFIDPDVDIYGTSPTGANLTAKNIAPVAWVPNLHYVQPIDDQWAMGASLTSNYGLATEFAPDYAAGAFGGKTDLKTLNLNLSTAYRLNKQFSFGVGFDAVYADAKIDRYAGDLLKIIASQLPPQQAQPLASLPNDTKIAHLKGSKWGFGWNAGILYELNEDNRYSFTYRSEVRVKFHGDYHSNYPSALNPIGVVAGLPYGTDGRTVPGSLTLHLPEIWEVSGYNKVAPQWAVHYTMAYTSWSQFQELKATGDNGQLLFSKHEGFRDAYRIALGTSYFYDDNWTFRTGIAFDDSPVPAQNRSISIPDQDRLWLSLGSTYAFNQNASVDAGISYMHGKKVNITEGPYQFRSEGKGWLYGANFNYTF